MGEEERWGDLMIGVPTVGASGTCLALESHTRSRSAPTTLTFIATTYYYYHSTGVYIYLVECIDTSFSFFSFSFFSW